MYYVTSAMKKALAHPRAEKMLVPHGGANRIEISLSRQVLVLYHNKQVELISHVSTGGHYYFCSGDSCGYAVTPTGNYRTVVFLPGWVTVPLGEMYNPVFFIGTAFAIHGEHRRAAGARLARLRPDPDGHRRVLPQAGDRPGRAGLHPLAGSG